MGVIASTVSRIGEERAVLDDADRELVTLILSVDPDGTERSLDREQLVAWYRKLGFEFIDPEEGITMRRPA